MRGVDWTMYFSAIFFGCLYKSSEALASGIAYNNNNGLQRVSSRLFDVLEPTDFGGGGGGSSLPPVQQQQQFFPSRLIPRQQRRRRRRSSSRSPLFSSIGGAAASSGEASLSSISASAVKQGLLNLRGGGTGLAVTKFARSILDDIGASKRKCWAVLVVSILLETTASTLSKKARDASNPGLFLFSISLNLISLCGFCTALAKLDVGVAYACWAALGTVIVTAAGVMFFQEAMDPLKMISILFVILGVVGLNLGDSH